MKTVLCVCLKKHTRRFVSPQAKRARSMSDDQHMPKWALDPLLTESSPLQSGGRAVPGHGAVNSGGGMEEPDSEAEYDSELSDEDMGRVR